MQAVTEAEKVRARFRSEEFKTGLFGDIQSIFDDAVALLMETAQTEAAFEVSERARTRPPGSCERSCASECRRHCFRCSPGPGCHRRATRTALPDGVVVVAYHVLPYRTYAWVIRRSGFSPVVLEVSRETLVSAVKGFRESILKQQLQTPGLAADLYTQLVLPLGLMGDEAVVIVPHDVLHYLPFHALHGSERYLIEERPISLCAIGKCVDPVADQGTETEGAGPCPRKSGSWDTPTRAAWCPVGGRTDPNTFPYSRSLRPTGSDQDTPHGTGAAE